jgi:arginine:pyruvate transaminase
MRTDYKRRSRIFADRLARLFKVMVPHRPQAGMFIIVDVSATGHDGDSFRLEAAGGRSGGDAGILLREPTPAI